MKVLIGNFHNSKYGGGDIYTYQVAKAISSFAEILFINEPNKGLFKENPDLALNSRIWNGREPVDVYININHFNALVCNTAKRNINLCLFPNKTHKVSEYSDIVTICDYSHQYVADYWNEIASVCQPYSANIVPGVKVPKTIASVGNFFMEKDGHSKNQHVLIAALASLGEGWKLSLIGGVVNKDYLAKCQKAAEGLNVEILPECSTAMKNHILATSQFYWHANGYGRVDPYQTEHFGIAPEEALKAGCLTYVHHSGGAKDFCNSWDSIADLLQMTKSAVPNSKPANFQTPEKMKLFWQELLNAPQA